MNTTQLIILGFILLIVILIFTKRKAKKKYEHQDILDNIHARIAKANGATIEHFSLENTLKKEEPKEDIYSNVEFVNKHCTRLEDFIINDKINEIDLKKLADLNDRELEISKGWYPLVIDLVIELNANGWKKDISCIKEKYASLRFSFKNEYNSKLYTIVEKYERKSNSICETCGEKGRIRYNTDWDYVACRKHYLENRGTVVIEKNGFNYNRKSYAWIDIKDASFEDADYYERYGFLKFEFKKTKIKHPGWSNNILYVSRYTIGFGNLLNHLPERIPSLNRDYLKQYQNSVFCEICGYKAVYFDECECCENETWKDYLKKWKKEKSTEERRLDHIKNSQMYWKGDEGELYESKQKNYIKNPEHVVLYTPQELKLYYNEDE